MPEGMNREVMALVGDIMKSLKNGKENVNLMGIEVSLTQTIHTYLIFEGMKTAIEATGAANGKLLFHANLLVLKNLDGEPQFNNEAIDLLRNLQNTVTHKNVMTIVFSEDEAEYEADLRAQTDIQESIPEGNVAGLDGFFSLAMADSNSGAGIAETILEKGKDNHNAHIVIASKPVVERSIKEKEGAALVSLPLAAVSAAGFAPVTVAGNENEFIRRTQKLIHDWRSLIKFINPWDAIRALYQYMRSVQAAA